MKIYLSVYIISLLLLSSCLKQEDFVDMSPCADEITACVTQTKTMTEDGAQVLWEDDDRIGLFVANSSTQAERKRSAVYQTSLATPSAEAVFTKIDDHKAGIGNGLYYAVYPVEAISRWGSQNAMDNQPTARRCYVTIPVEQVAVKGGWDRKAGILAASSQNSSFAFNHAVSYIKFTVADSSTDFVRMTVRSAAGEPIAAKEAAVLYLLSTHFFR